MRHTAIATFLYPRLVSSCLASRASSPEFDVRRVRHLNKYALALTHAQALYLAAPERSPSIHPPMNTAIEHRA